MNPFAWAREWFIYATQVLVDLAMACYMSYLLPDFLGDGFNLLSNFTARVSGALFDAANWYDDVVYWIEQILDWDTIYWYLSEWLNMAERAWAWVSNAWSNTLSIIDNWWSGVQGDIQGWIDIAVQGLVDVKVAFDNFLAVTLPNLVDFSSLAAWGDNILASIQSLIDSAFVLRESLWDGWQDIHSNFKDFFDDPLQWIYSKLDEFIERFW